MRSVVAATRVSSASHTASTDFYRQELSSIASALRLNASIFRTGHHRRRPGWREC
jgi:hypothetical protein